MGRRKARLHGRTQNRVPAGIDDPEDREQRQQQQRRRRKARPRAGVPRPEPQPHVDADRAVNPYDDEQGELARQRGARLGEPEQVEDAEIGIIEAIEQDPEPRIGYVGNAS
jgi:hypothetical protein